MLIADVHFVLEPPCQILPAVERLGARRAQPLIAVAERETEILGDAFVVFEFQRVEPGRRSTVGRLRQEGKCRQAGLIGHVRIVDQQCADEHMGTRETVREHGLNGSQARANKRGQELGADSWKVSADMGYRRKCATANSDQRGRTSGLGGGYRQDRRCARTVGVEQHDRGELPIGQYRRRRQQCCLRCMADAHHAQHAVVVGVILPLRRRRAIAVGVSLAHADAVEHIRGLCLRRTGKRHDEQDLAPCGKHQSGKANGAYPSV